MYPLNISSSSFLGGLPILFFIITLICLLYKRVPIKDLKYGVVDFDLTLDNSWARQISMFGVLILTILFSLLYSGDCLREWSTTPRHRPIVDLLLNKQS